MQPSRQEGQRDVHFGEARQVRFEFAPNPGRDAFEVGVCKPSISLEEAMVELVHNGRKTSPKSRSNG